MGEAAKHFAKICPTHLQVRGHNGTVIYGTYAISSRENTEQIQTQLSIDQERTKPQSSTISVSNKPVTV